VFIYVEWLLCHCAFHCPVEWLLCCAWFVTCCDVMWSVVRIPRNLTNFDAEIEHSLISLPPPALDYCLGQVLRTTKWKNLNWVKKWKGSISYGSKSTTYAPTSNSVRSAPICTPSPPPISQEFHWSLPVRDLHVREVNFLVESMRRYRTLFLHPTTRQLSTNSTTTYSLPSELNYSAFYFLTLFFSPCFWQNRRKKTGDRHLSSTIKRKKFMKHVRKKVDVPKKILQKLFFELDIARTGELPHHVVGLGMCITISVLLPPPPPNNFSPPLSLKALATLCGGRQRDKYKGIIYFVYTLYI